MATEKKKLTLKQKRFADEYIISGNASEAARKAGYSPKTAGRTAFENLDRPHIREYIAERLRKLDAKKKMELKEVVERTSSIARGEVQTGYRKIIDRQTGDIIKEHDYVYTPSLEESQRSMEHLFRCYGAFNDKLDIQTKGVVEINFAKASEEVDDG